MRWIRSKGQEGHHEGERVGGCIQKLTTDPSKLSTLKENRRILTILQHEYDDGLKLFALTQPADNHPCMRHEAATKYTVLILHVRTPFPLSSFCFSLTLCLDFFTDPAILFFTQAVTISFHSHACCRHGFMFHFTTIDLEIFHFLNSILE